MGLHHQLQMAGTFANLIAFIQVRVYKFEMIIQKPCQEIFNEDDYVLKQ